MATKSMVAANDTAFAVPANARVEGLIAIPADVDLRGVVDGEIRCKRLLIHRGAHVLGTIVADHVEIFGQVRDGTIAADRVRIAPGCDVEAEIYYTQLDIEEGGLFEGRTRRHDNPKSLVPLD